MNLIFKYGFDIIIDAKLSYDEGFDLKVIDNNLKFTWKCSGIFTFICANTTTNTLKIKFQEYNYLIKDLISIKTFEIELNLEKDIRSASKKFNFYLEPIEKKNIINNNNENNNTPILKKEEKNLSELITITPFIIKGTEFIIFKSNFVSEEYIISDYKYKWTISNFKDDLKYLNSRQESNLKISRNDLLLGFNNILLEIFNPNQNITFRKILNYLKPIPPYGGNCRVNPPNGIFGKDIFEFTFSGWISESLPLIYKVKYLDNKNNYIDVSLGGVTGLNEIKMTSKALPVGENFALEVSDNSDYKTIIPCQLKVISNKELTKLEDFMTNVFDPLEKQLYLESYKSNLEAKLKSNSNNNPNANTNINTKSNITPYSSTNPNSINNPKPKNSSSSPSTDNSSYSPNPNNNSNSSTNPKSTINPSSSPNQSSNDNTNTISDKNTNNNLNSKENIISNNDEINPNPEIISLNDMIIGNTYYLLTSTESKSISELQDMSSSLLTIMSQYFHSHSIKLIFKSVEIIGEKVEDYSENKILLGSTFELIDNLIITIEKNNIDTIDTLSKYDSIKNLETLNDKVISCVSNKLISGESFSSKSPTVDIKLTKISNLNIIPISMDYEDDQKLFRRSKRKIKARFLQNQNDRTECDPDISVICLDKEKVKKMMNSSPQANIQFNGQLYKEKKLLIEEEQFSNSLNFHIFSPVENDKNKNSRILLRNNQNENNDKIVDKIYFEVRLKFPKDKTIEELGPATCVQYQDNKIAKPSCFSLYDLDTKEIICQCEKQGLTVNVLDKNLAKLSKIKQFPPLNRNICNISIIFF